MQGLCSNSALFWAPEKTPVRWPLLILSPRLALGTPKNAGVTYRFRPLLRPREGACEVATSDFVPALGVGDARECRGYVAIAPAFGASRGHVSGGHV